MVKMVYKVCDQLLVQILVVTNVITTAMIPAMEYVNKIQCTRSSLHHQGHTFVMEYPFLDDS
jgi:hypothetical protein